MATVINYDSVKSGLPEKILILVSILEVFSNSDLTWESPFSNMSTSISLPTYATKAPGPDVGCKPW